MAYLPIRHKVEDFSKWKPVFDQHGSTREAYGSKGDLFRNADTPNEVVLRFKFDDLEKACQFTNYDELKNYLFERQRLSILQRIRRYLT